MAHRFEESYEQRVDINHEFQLPSMLASRWLSIRLELLGNILVVISVLIALLFTDPDQSNMAALGVTSALTITNTMNLLVRISTELEGNLLSVERCLDYTKLQSEVNFCFFRFFLNFLIGLT